MTYDQSDGSSPRRSDETSRTGRSPRSGSVPLVRSSMSSQGGRRPSASRRGSRGAGSGRPSRSSGTFGTSYTLSRHNINFSDRRFSGGSDRRTIILVVAAIVVVTLLVFGISSCVRSCSAGGEQQATTQAQTNSQDSRVAAGVSSDMTSRLTTALDRNDKLSQIAANAGAYPSERMLALALDEPAAIDFVAAWPDADKTAAAYSDAVTQGTVPALLMFDQRWGNVDYGGLPLGLTGSAPTCLSMAYMGLTGKADKTPADVASLLVEDGCATGETDPGTDSTGLGSVASSLGLAMNGISADYDSISSALASGEVVVCEVRASTLTSYDHFVVLVANADDTLGVHDPTSTEVSSHAWSYTTIASAAESVWGLSLAVS